MAKLLTHKSVNMIGKLSWLLPSFLSVFVISAQANATNLTSLRFNPNNHQLELQTDEGVQPQIQLIANPDRLAIDLPGVVMVNAETSHKRINSVIPDIRVGQADEQTTRIVIELSPNYTLDINKVSVRAESSKHWVFQLPTPQPIAANYPYIPPETQSTGQSISIISPQRNSRYFLSEVVPVGTKMSQVIPQIQSLRQKYKFLASGMFFLDLDNGDYLDVEGDRVFPAASTIKLPILVAFYQDLEAGKVSLDDTLVMRRSLMTGGSGNMQYKRPGTKYSARETLWKMITISDNTATNMIIDRLGGIAKLNQRFRSWGLEDTVIRNWLADLRGTNTTSSKDMVRLLALVTKDKLVSASSQAQIFDVLNHTVTNTLLPAGLGSGASIANKTGDIGFAIGDAGIITMPNGKRYLAAIFVKRPYKDSRGRDFIRQVSRSVYNYLEQQVTSLPYRS